MAKRELSRHGVTFIGTCHLSSTSPFRVFSLTKLYLRGLLPLKMYFSREETIIDWITVKGNKSDCLYYLNTRYKKQFPTLILQITVLLRKKWGFGSIT